MHIQYDDLQGTDIIALLEEHLADMFATSPAESVHALDLNALKAPDIHFFSARKDGKLMGCVAVKQHSDTEAELKSMRTTRAARGTGAGYALLLHAISFCREKGFTTLSLETGTQPFFDTARKLYYRNGFKDCGPFASYQPDPNSHFMTLAL